MARSRRRSLTPGEDAHQLGITTSGGADFSPRPCQRITGFMIRRIRADAVLCARMDHRAARLITGVYRAKDPVIDRRGGASYAARVIGKR